jgi:hypothetical protein
MNNIKYIGVSGLARSGKNLFCEIATKQILETYGFRAKTYALAYQLKKDCADFVKDKLGLDVFSERTEDKNVFRELLVWYGATKRKQTQGRYWVELLQKHIELDIQLEKDLGKPVDVVLISDIRFAEYSKDEVYWIKNELNGKLVHISKYKWDSNYYEKSYVLPPNISETTNDPKVKSAADYKLEWEEVDNTKYNQLINNVYLNSYVKDVLDTIL